jgi:hypothetical protein
VIRFRVRDRRLKSVRLAAPGPNGKGVIAVTFPVQGPDLARYVEVPEGVQVGDYGEALKALIASGTLLPPPAPEA